MSFMEELLLNGGPRYNGGQNAPIGSFFNARTNCIFQQTADGALPACGTFIQVTTSGTSTLTQCATAINALVAGLNYTSANLHTYTTADLAPYPGQAANDA
jgi:hypothetical protein